MKKIIQTVKILKNTPLTDNYYLMQFENRNKDLPQSGHFINIRITNIQHTFLRRPFAVFSSSKNSITILYKVVGPTTSQMSTLKKGDTIEYLGFLGNPFNKIIQKKNIWIIAGGIGLGGIHLFYEKMKRRNNIELFLGFNTVKEAHHLSAIIKDKSTKLHIAVMEKQKKYIKGNVVNLLLKQKHQPDLIYACGPEIMLKNIWEQYLRSKKIPAFFSMESVMACGIGSCMGCTIKIKDKKGYIFQRVCKEGPIFKVDDIIWDE